MAEIRPSEGIITLYDIPSTNQPMAWSPNTWKVRFALNFKKIPYKTVWISYPDIKPTLASFKGCVDEKDPKYTLPVIAIPAPDDKDTPTYVQDSWVIIEYLDAHYPETPKLFPPGTRALQETFNLYVRSALGASITPIVVPEGIHRLENDAAKEYYRTSRVKSFGCKLEEVCPVGEKRDAAWEKVKVGLDKVAAVLDRNEDEGENKWVMCKHGPTFADFMLCSSFIWVEKMGPEGGWDMIKQWNGGRWAKMLEDVKDYMEVL